MFSIKIRGNNGFGLYIYQLVKVDRNILQYQTLLFSRYPLDNSRSWTRYCNMNSRYHS
ncbi:hypothetical protein HanXRQr2_Chr11g0493871 [Helianthus annuus]|uniref:Uncharacterized protein n=1 Tax=Helianthus annuus TaxID=4232 RepID=A0A9K3N080_HELAN|nr:hypothetical protein HanXRQr2_Chr11g0493871 [Helianthus annuus]KAJ0875386.1 hypothetical protein HanPSC8_Chr11g0475801 [Helianthus annuus]